MKPAEQPALEGDSEFSHTRALGIRMAAGEGPVEGVEVQLGKRWVVGPQVGRGGFGAVFRATAGEEEAALKFVPKEVGANRDLLLQEVGDACNVMPVLDHGEHGSHWVFLMPLAECSLRQHLVDIGGPLSPRDAIEVLRDIVRALVDLDGRVVHRDIKPENVLRLAGRWCLTDFGISRYAEATTSPETKKLAWTPPYASPEQWRVERATAKSDIYSVGVVAHELLGGAPPFIGPSIEEFREQHLHADPPELSAVPDGLAEIVEECLMKAPGGRPTPARLLALLERAQAPAPSGGLAALQEASRGDAMRRAERMRSESEAQTRSDARRELIRGAVRSFGRLSAMVARTLEEAAPSAEYAEDRRGGWSLRLGDARLSMAPPAELTSCDWGNWEPPAFDVLAASQLRLTIPPNQVGYEGRSHSLWYCDAKEAGEFGWFETAFMNSPMIPKQVATEPFALDPGAEAAKALWTGMAEFQAAWPFTELSAESREGFIGRWADWFATAASGRLSIPRQMPELSPEGSWRRG